MKIFSGTSNKPLAEKIASACGVSLSPIDQHIFPDGERRVRIPEPVLDMDTVVVLPTGSPVDTNYMELFFILDGLKRSGAHTRTAVIPYMGYARQDHIFRDGEAVSIDVVIRLIEAAGATKVIALDLHAIKTAELFSILMVHLSALPLFAQKIKEIDPSLKNSVLVTPDLGGIRRIKIVSDLLKGMPHIAIEKNRDVNSGAINASGIRNESGESLQGKTAFIIDDMISSGGTIAQAAGILKKQGVKNIYVFATHAVFSDKAPTILQEGEVEKVFVTDTLYVAEDKQFKKLEIISVASLVAQELKNH